MIRLKDILLIQYDKSRDGLPAIISKKPCNESVNIVLETGETILHCTNNTNPTEFDKFLKEIRLRINAKEKTIYTKQVRSTTLQRSLFINPRYENSPLLKKKEKQAGFYYPLIICLLIIITFMIVINLFAILEII